MSDGNEPKQDGNMEEENAVPSSSAEVSNENQDVTMEEGNAVPSSADEVATDKQDKQLLGLKTTTMKKKKRKKDLTFTSHIYGCLKKHHPGMGITRNTMGIVDALVVDLSHCIANEAGAVCKFSNVGTLSARALCTAARLKLPTDFAEMINKEAMNALKYYTTAIEEM